ncbi:hypothetical protein AMTRI_Chr08g204450 [Amborella trichopoda]
MDSSESSNDFNVELGTQLNTVFYFPILLKNLKFLFGDLSLFWKNLFGDTNEVIYHSWVKEGVYSICYCYSRLSYVDILGKD